MKRKPNLLGVTGLVGEYAKMRCRRAGVPVGSTVTECVANLRQGPVHGQHDAMLWLIGEYEREFPDSAANPATRKQLHRLRGKVLASVKRVERQAAEAAERAAYADVLGKDFYASQRWRRLRYQVLKARGGRCECCGRTAATHAVVLHVDHIKPRSTHPELALEETNLQVLCEDCNMGKSFQDDTDWRANHAGSATSQ